MCFSASASFVSGAAVLALGTATLSLVPDRRELLFASLPVAFGVHQILEGVVWLQVERAGATSMPDAALVAWLAFAWLLLPVWVPVSVWLFEPEPERRRWMLGLAVLGGLVGLFLFGTAVDASSTVTINQHHLEYRLPLHPGWLFAAPYVVVTCVPLLIASHRFVVRFGIAVTVSMALTALTASRQFSSVWCFFAALLSIGLAAHYVSQRRSAAPLTSVRRTARR